MLDSKEGRKLQVDVLVLGEGKDKRVDVAHKSAQKTNGRDGLPMADRQTGDGLMMGLALRNTTLKEGVLSVQEKKKNGEQRVSTGKEQSVKAGRRDPGRRQGAGNTGCGHPRDKTS